MTGPAADRSVPVRWLSARAVGLHLALVVAFPGCLAAGWWQVQRAMSGNGLSYAYAIEWPIFAVLSVIGWWQLLHTPPAADRAPLPAPAAAAPRWDRSQESEALQAYNAKLARLARASGRQLALPPAGATTTQEAEH